MVVLAETSPDTFLQLLMHTAGAVTVTGIFVWYLIRRDFQQTEREKQVSEHLDAISERNGAQADKMLGYLQSRDAQSKEIAMSGHAALRDITREVSELRKGIRCDAPPIPQRK